MKSEILPALMTFREIRAYTGWSPVTLWRRKKDEAFPTVYNIGRIKAVRLDDFRRYIETMREDK